MNIGDEVIYCIEDKKAKGLIKIGQKLRVINFSTIGFVDCLHAMNESNGSVHILPASCLEVVKSKNTELLAFVAHRVQLCQQDNFYGSLTVIFENGKVVRAKTERSEVPS